MLGGDVISANIQAEGFPPISAYTARTVIIGRLDITSKSPTVATETDERREPCTFYLENTLPTPYGYAAVGYSQALPPAVGQTFKRIFEARDDTGNKWYLGQTRTGLMYVDSNVMDEWRELRFHPELAAFEFWDERTLTFAQVEGVSYFYVANWGCFALNFDFAETESVTLTGLDASQIRGICSAGNYMIAYDNATVYWGAADNILDFVPDLDTGADSMVPVDLRGQIVSCSQLPQGFMIYTTNNAISASYTNNITSPWVFREVAGSSGIVDAEQVSSDENFAEHIVWSNAGLMQISRADAKLIHPEISDFLGGRVLEIPTAGELFPVRTALSTSMRTKIQLVGARYLVVSYGQFVLEYALIYDMALKRWGKLNIAHVDVFEVSSTAFNNSFVPWTALKSAAWKVLAPLSWNDLLSYPQDLGTPKHNLGIVQSDGTVVVVNIDELNLNRTGKLMLGRFRLTRNNFAEIQSILLNYINRIESFTVKVSPSYNGVTRETPVTFTLGDSANGVAQYLEQVIGYDLIIIIEGCFSLSDVEFSMYARGRS